MTADSKQLFTQHAQQLTAERAQEISAEWIDNLEADVTRVLSDVQHTALDLYERGFNVFPIKPQDKKPYLLKPLFNSRLHHCGALCTHKGHEDISQLFSRDNIAIMTGRTSGNLLVVDCDSHASFEKIGNELTGRSLPYWAITGRRGGAYLLRVIEGEAANMPKDKSKFDDVEIWGNRHLVVIPPSVHPSGIMYQWAMPEPRYHMPKGETLPAVSIAALDWLGVILAKSAKRWEEPELYNLPQWAAALSYTSRETFGGMGVSEGERNTKLFALLCEVKANGRNYHEAESIALDYARRVGLADRETLDTLKSAYSQDRTTPSQHYSGERGGERVRVREWQRAQAFAESFDWRGTFGRKAGTRRACYMACIDRARQDGRLHWRATTREIAERLRTTSKSSWLYLKDLARVKLIKLIASENEGVYRFLQLSELTTVGTTGSYSVVNSEAPKTQGEQDVTQKIGLTGWYVWRYLLTNEARNGAQIAKNTGLPQSSVYAALKLLQDGNVRLVSSSEGVLYGEPRTEASLQSMALFWNDGASPSQARKQKHVIERELYATWQVRKARENWENRQHD
jgi:hypothetical protein